MPNGNDRKYANKVPAMLSHPSPFFPKIQQNLISLFNMKARKVLRLLNNQYKIEEIQPFITNFVIISMSRVTIIFTILFFGCLVNSNETFACKKSNGKIASASSNHSSAENNKKESCCKKQDNSEQEHDCSKKCEDHKCECPNYSVQTFLKLTEPDSIPSTEFYTNKSYPILKPSFYNDVYISIWQPPKIV